MADDMWAVGEAYEAYVGRWSRLVAADFVRWLDPSAGWQWLDVGCGTGALTAAVLGHADPLGVVGVDPSEGFLDSARARIGDPRADFRTGDALALPFRDNSFDAVVSGLMLNFVPDPGRAVAGFTRVARAGGFVEAYVWDYAEGMGMMRHFWDAAVQLDPAASTLEEGLRFQLCRPDALRSLWTAGGLGSVEVEGIEIPTVFASFGDYWRPFLGGQGPAPGYVMSLPEDRRAALRDLLRARLPANPDGTIPLSARAWAIRGTVPTP